MTGSRRLKLIQSASIGGILLLTGQWTSAAPVCAEVLRDSASYSLTIQNLAQLKLGFDLNQVQGTNEQLGTQAVHAQFNKKLAAFLESISNEKSKADVRVQIKKEIARLQGFKEEAQASREKQDREATRIIEKENRIAQYPIALKQRIDLQGPVLAKNITYSEETNSVVLSKTKMAISELIQYGTKDGSKNVIAANHRLFTMTADRNFVLYLTADNKKPALVKYDLLNKAETSRMQISSLQDVKFDLNLSPSDSYILGVANATPRGGKKFVRIIDPTTGYLLKTYVTRDYLENAQFISDDAVLIQFSDKLVLWNWKTNQRSSLSIKNHSKLTSLNSDKSVLTVVSDPSSQEPTVIQYRTKDFKKVASQKLRTVEDDTVMIAETVPNDPEFFVYNIFASDIVPYQKLIIAHKRDLNSPAYDFSNDYGPTIAHEYRLLNTTPAFSKDGKKFLINSANGRNQSFIDIWQVAE
jgi:hypothetical protein